MPVDPARRLGQPRSPPVEGAQRPLQMSASHIWRHLPKRPRSTVQFTAELLADPASLDPALPLRHRAEMISLRDGFFVEARQLWHGEELVALNQQTFVIIK